MISKVLKLSSRMTETVTAAAQLHDIGKLAIPDYILNKPGELTATERRLMNTHPVVGAQILEGIPFPGPVLPAVRHHHEAWDGSGYPDGLKSTEIPLAARILAVADYFDALSWDRPWQAGLNGPDAFAVIKAGAGRLFDPKVVQALERCPFWKKTAAEIKVKEVPMEKADAGAAALKVIAEAQRDSRLLHETLLELGASLDLGETFEVIGRHLGEKMPDASGVIYLARHGATKLEATYSWGPGRECLIGRQIDRGLGAAGAALETGDTIINVDPGPDLVGVNPELSRRLQSAAAVPLVDATGLVEGIIALYAEGDAAFSVAQIQWIGGFSSKAAEAIRNARRFGEAQAAGLNDEETAPALATTTWEQLETDLTTCRQEGSTLIVMVVRLQGLNEVEARSGPQMREQVMGEIATHISRQTGPGIFMGKGGRDSFILMGMNLAQGEASTLRQRIEQEIASLRCVIGPAHIAGVTPSVGMARFPQDGRQART
ncbi:MAG: HD domain-containing phosphohydrolase, partial [Acidobacteriota bacterium]